MWYLWNCLIVFAFGSLFGLAEIIQKRHLDDKYAFYVWQSYFYIVINGCVSVIALLLIKYFSNHDISFESIEWGNIVIAGFSGMMVLRSSIFSYQPKNGGEKIGIGLDPIVQIFLDWVEGKIDKKAGAKRMPAMRAIMRDVRFDAAKNDLPALCAAVITNFPAQITSKLVEEITSLDSNKEFSEESKTIQLGLLISKYCDEAVLKAVIDNFPRLKEVVTADEDQVLNSKKSIDYWKNNL
jgi:hypothetical protein